MGFSKCRFGNLYEEIPYQVSFIILLANSTLLFSTPLPSPLNPNGLSLGNQFLCYPYIYLVISLPAKAMVGVNHFKEIHSIIGIESLDKRNSRVSTL